MEGRRPSEILSKLGTVDFRAIKVTRYKVYEWKTEATVEETVRLIDNVHEALRGLEVQFTAQMINDDEILLQKL